VAGKQSNPGSDPNELYKPYRPGFDVDPFPVYARLRESAPIFYWEEGRSWVLSRHEDVVAILRDDRFVTDRRHWEHTEPYHASLRMPALELFMKHSLISLSIADHQRVRRLVAPAFSPRAIELLRPMVHEIVDDILDSLAGRETLDVVRDFAEPIPNRVLSRMLKLPREHEEPFRRFAEAIVQLLNLQLPPEELTRVSAPIPEALSLIEQVIEDRRRNPIADDVLTTLVQAEERGARLSRAELLALIMALIAAGVEATIYSISYTIYNLLCAPAALAEVRKTPALVKCSFEETLRFDNFLKFGVIRFATEDVDLHGVKIRKGQMVTGLLGSAMRDHAVFPGGDTFDIHRDTSASIAFGAGIHHCLGVSLGRLEGQIAVGAFLHRYPELRLAGPPVFGTHAFIRKMESFPVIVRAGG